MRMTDFISEQNELDFVALKKDLKTSDMADNIKVELESWFSKIIKNYRFDENKMIRSEYKRYFMDMIKASDFTAEYYKIPKFTVGFIRKNLPSFLLKNIEERYGDEDNILLVVFFFFLNEVINISYLMGGEVWNFKLFKEGQIYNDDMKEIESRKEEYKDENK